MQRRRTWIALALACALAACRGPGAAGEHPELAREVRLRFQGAKALTEDELRRIALDEMSTEVEKRLSKVAIDDAAYAIEQAYRDHGYPDALVDYDYEEREGREPRATFRIQEGPHVVLKSIALPGMKSLPRSDVLELFPSIGGDYVENDVRNGASTLQAYYVGSGYLKASVAAPEAEVDEDAGEASVVVHVDEGPLFELRAVTVEGAQPEHDREMEKSAGASIGSPYTRRLAEAIRAEILHSEEERGHPDATVAFDVEADQETGRVELAFHVHPGDRVRVKEIRIEGYDELQPSVVRARLALEEGDVYTASAVRKSFSQLYASGLFQSVDIRLQGEGTERTLVVEVKERPSLELKVEPGYGSYEGPRLVLGVTENNVLGTGRRVSFESVVGRLAQRADVNLVEPWLFGRNLSGALDVYGNHREEPSFTLTEAGTGLTFTRRWTSQLSTSLRYAYRRTRLSNVQVVTPEVTKLASNVDVSSISFTIDYDTTRDPFSPRQGSRSRAQVEWASHRLGSQIDFVGGSILHSRYLPLGQDTTLAMTGRTGVIVPTAGEEIPLQLRLFLGGENSVRSFHENELGPKDANGEPFGGEGYTLASVELRQELVGRLSGAVFVDAGHVARTIQDYTSTSGGGLAVGLGLRYLLPIGHVRLDGGFNPIARPGEDDFVLHLAVGMAF